MKIGILFDLSNPEAGGAFSFNKAIHQAVIDFPRSSDFELVCIFKSTGLKDMVADIELPGIWLYRFHFLQTFLVQVFKFILSGKRVSLSACRSRSMNEFIEKHEIDFVWAVQPLGISLKVPFVTTSWDISHKITPYFSELNENSNSLDRRDSVCKEVFSRAYRIIVGTLHGKLEIQNAYGINEERILVQSFPVFETEPQRIMPREPNKFYYPANFWNHKNHLLILEALLYLKKNNQADIKMVFSGADKGLLNFLNSKILEWDLSALVEITGFIEDSQVQLLYSSVNAVIFPSLIGPDNLPPLEALARGCRVAVSDIPGAREQFGLSALYFSPTDPVSLANLMLELVDTFGLEDDNSRDSINGFRNPNDYVAGVIEEIRSAPRAIREIAAQQRYYLARISQIKGER
jgi:glycosyltransferase involved in cell wall biosynthesis